MSFEKQPGRGDLGQLSERVNGVNSVEFYIMKEDEAGGSWNKRKRREANKNKTIDKIKFTI